jgi:hypothetical protein
VKDEKGKRFIVSTRKKEYLLKADNYDACGDWISVLCSFLNAGLPARHNSSVTFHPCVTVKTFECAPHNARSKSSVDFSEAGMFASMLKQRFSSSGGKDEDYDPAVKKVLQLLESRDSSNYDDSVVVNSTLSPSTTEPLKCNGCYSISSYTSGGALPVGLKTNIVSSPSGSPAEPAPPIVGASVRDWNPWFDDSTLPHHCFDSVVMAV